MKQIILSLIVLLGASLNACMAKDNQTSETRNISGYTSIRIDGVATVRFAQSDTWSCRIEGKAEEKRHTNHRPTERGQTGAEHSRYNPLSLRPHAR